jgi:hypothetical protein
MAAVEDEDAQRKGVVAVMYNLRIFKTEGVKKVYTVTDSLPMRHAAVHYCFDSPSLQPAMSVFKLLASGNVRMRFRSHFGKMELLS